jgi:hypothetical protein
MGQQTVQRRAKQVAKTSSSRARGRSDAGLAMALAFLLVAGTLLLYSPVRRHVFINYDDVDYVINNPHVTAGLSWATVRWSLTSTEKSNWHPVTWLSHALDCQLFGLSASRQHMSSLTIHAVNVLLLFLLLRQATGAVGCSFVVAALFAWHPFNVQSVAWIAERKNLLSTFFFLLTLGAYSWYVRKPDLKHLSIVMCGFALALASKPMAVTLPFVLLLLDYWPFQRLAGWTVNPERSSAPQQPLARLLLEKLPLLALSAASCAVTLWAQKAGGSVDFSVPLGTRVANAVYSYLIYLWKTFWPSGFAILYPLPNRISFWKPTIAALLLCAVSIAAWKQRVPRPYLVVGWLWFVGTLIPVIGIVQVGEQAMADRYAYLPLIGLFVIVVWGLAELSIFRPVGLWGRCIAVCALLGALTSVTYRQISYWENSLTLWSHSLSVTGENLTVEQQMASLLIANGRSDLALPHLLAVARLNPRGRWTPVYLGTAFMAEGRFQDAAEQFETVTQLSDHMDLNFEGRRYRSSSLLNLGIVYLLLQDYPRALMAFHHLNQFDPPLLEEAIDGYNRSLAANPSEVGYLKLSMLLQAEGKNREAFTLLDNVTKANPDYEGARQLLSYLKSNQN